MTVEKHFPTILGLVLLLICIAASIYLTGFRTTLGSKASGDCTPINPQVANITDSSADISYITSAACLATVSVNSQIFNDVKPATATKIHYFQIKGLKNSTAYNYSLVTNGQTINKTAYNFKTGSTPASSLPTSNLAWGRVLSADKKSVANAIVYLNIPGAFPLSSFVTTDGNWSISLASSFNDSQTDWFVPPSTAVEENIVVISEDNVTTQVVNSTALNNPVPDIIIGQNSLTAPTVVPTSAGNLANVTPVQTSQNLDILNPQNGETLPSTRPEFFGTAPINSNVVIEVHSDATTSANVQSDNTGSWNWSPPSDLAPGDHTITVKVQDPSTGVWQTVTRNFTVLATGNGSPAFVASGSATTITPTSTIINPTSKPTITPTVTPTPIVRAAQPASASTKPPVTGNELPTVIIITSALLFFLISVKFI
jgi:Bacterial Ig-like domain